MIRHVFTQSNGKGIEPLIPKPKPNRYRPPVDPWKAFDRMFVCAENMLCLNRHAPMLANEFLRVEASVFLNFR
jgi:hypothetical protein